MTFFVTVHVLFLVILIFVQDVLCLRNVRLTIEPNIVQRGSNSTLHCSYDLENDDVLYSVKWYRGRYEFYRYIPSELPIIKTFPFKGINVDEKNSNSTQVLLKDIDFKISGNFSCEVTTDAPFSTGYDRRTMVVVQLPENPPTISVEGEPLDYGDTLRANCSCPPSKPQASLMLLLNNLTVAKIQPSFPNKHENPLWSDLPLAMTLAEEHFNGGRLILRCVAEIGEIYREEAVLKLGSVRDPVPERVSAYSVGTFCENSRALLQIITLISIMSMFS
ncbi:unnamed protein product [Psylliodes chrysocephalus]|uniref:Ig-like domain-containing protein n=1 Tax=Psylliodes chrysocephalus TaxID=3402493 RepID=A0A9P0D5T3_9CUCU|nr:unnamed protein product [Psylliodes chrysocephala]